MRQETCRGIEEMLRTRCRGCCQSNWNCPPRWAAPGPWEASLMKPLSFKRHRYPAGVIRQALWLDFRFTLSLRDIEGRLDWHERVRLGL